MKWFRFYNEVLEDPKVQCLTPDLFKFWVNVLCIASKNDGKLPDTKAVAYHIRASESATQSLLNALLEARLLQEFSNQHGKWLAPHAWQKRQYKSDVSTDRVKRFRNGKRNNVVTPPDTDTDTDTEQNKKIIKKRKINDAVRLPYLSLPEEWVGFCQEEMGWNIEQSESAWKNFYDYSNGADCKTPKRKDWFTTFKNSCRNGITKPNINLIKGKQNGNYHNKPSAHDNFTAGIALALAELNDQQER